MSTYIQLGGQMKEAHRAGRQLTGFTSQHFFLLFSLQECLQA